MATAAARRATPTGDSGASLVLVMALVIGIGLIATALLGFASTSINSATKLAEATQTAYQVDGALKAAVNQLRNSVYVGGPCQFAPGESVLAFPAPDDDQVRVTCTQVPGTGGVGQEPLTVYFQAQLASGRPAGSASAQYSDPRFADSEAGQASAMIPGNRGVRILSWAVDR